MKKNLLLTAGFLMANVLHGQEWCGTDKKMKEFFKKHPEALARKADLDNYLSNKNNTAKLTQTVVTIPIVVHVLYKDAIQNISDAQIVSQIAVLNADFRKQNADFNAVVPDAFEPMAADLELAFCMATKDENGDPTTGIERKLVGSTFNFKTDYHEPSGLPAWDVTKYLNIWVVGELPDDLLGFATLPSSAGSSEDGLCIIHAAFGTMGTVLPANSKGRTATHEIGHYFGLEHPWGSAEYQEGNPDSNVCGTTGWDDFCADTPSTYYRYYGNPSFPNNDYTCTSSASGAMFMNFMDYVDDTHMAMFSNDQKTRTTNTMAGPRASLLNSNACSSPTLAVNEADKLKSINIFPNPTTQYISVASPVIKIDNLEIFNSEGRLVKKTGIKNETDKVNVREFAPGVYYVRIYDKNKFIKSMKFIKK